MATMGDEKTSAGPVVGSDLGAESDHGHDQVSPDAQGGVQDIQAVTKVWTKTALIIAYLMYVELFSVFGSSYCCNCPEYYWVSNWRL